MSEPLLDELRAVVDRLVRNDLAFGKPLLTEFPSRAMLRSDLKRLAALTFGDHISDGADDPLPSRSLADLVAGRAVQDDGLPTREALVPALAYALARTRFPDRMESSGDYAERLAPLVLESGYLLAAPPLHDPSGETSDER